jgi:integrase
MSGEGSVFRRASDGRWIAQLSSGPRGHRSYRTRSAATRTEAKRRLAELVADRDADVNPTTRSLGEYLRRWLDESARPSISPNTYRGYDDVIAHLEPIAGIPLNRLTAEDIEAALNGMHSRRGKAHAPAAPKTIRNAQLMLRRAWRRPRSVATSVGTSRS